MKSTSTWRAGQTVYIPLITASGRAVAIKLHLSNNSIIVYRRAAPGVWFYSRRRAISWVRLCNEMRCNRELHYRPAA